MKFQLKQKAKTLISTGEDKILLEKILAGVWTSPARSERKMKWKRNSLFTGVGVFGLNLVF